MRFQLGIMRRALLDEIHHLPTGQQHLQAHQIKVTEPGGQNHEASTSGEMLFAENGEIFQ